MNQIAVITGAGSGIGRALAIELATRREFNVVAVGRRLRALQETQIHYPERIKIVQADVSEPEGRKKIDEAVGNYRKIRLLVHNAAVLEPVARLAEIGLEEWRRHQAINLEGPLFLSQLLLPKMGQTRILLISSGAAHHAYAGWGAYCTSKAALNMLGQVMNKEWTERGIITAAVRPGVVNTNMQDSLRTADAGIFPALPKFLKLRDENKLIPPGITAKFLAEILLNTSDEEFTFREWDIYRDYQELDEQYKR